MKVAWETVAVVTIMVVAVALLSRFGGPGSQAAVSALCVVIAGTMRAMVTKHPADDSKPAEEAKDEAPKGS